MSRVFLGPLVDCSSPLFSFATDCTGASSRNMRVYYFIMENQAPLSLLKSQLRRALSFDASPAVKIGEAMTSLTHLPTSSNIWLFLDVSDQLYLPLWDAMSGLSFKLSFAPATRKEHFLR